MEGLTYRKAKLMMAKINKSLHEVVEKRHLVLSWVQTQRQREVIWEEVQNTIGKYRREVGGIPIAVGPVKVRPAIFLVDEGKSVHLEVEVPQIVFRPIRHGEYKCHVVSIDKKFSNGILFNKIPVVLTQKKKREGASEEVHIEEGKKVKFRFKSVEAKGKLCQIRGTLY